MVSEEESSDRDFWVATQIQGLGSATVRVADFAVADRPDLTAVRIGKIDKSCLLIDDLSIVIETLFEAIHQCRELEAKRQQGG